jgi:RNA polymerase sigma-70 factor (ECF subfamily)
VRCQEQQPKAIAEAAHIEAALLDCAAGRRAGVATLYAYEANKLRAIARRIVRSRERADDVIHDAFAQILRDAKSFDPSRGSARAWVYTIVRNTALKALHTANREVAVENNRLHSMCDGRQQADGEPPSRADDYAALRICLEKLEPKRRASLVLAIVDGRTHAEIAKYLRVPIGTVKAWIRRELISLRDQLE